MKTFETLWEQETFRQLNLVGQELCGVEFADCIFENCAFEQCSVQQCRWTDCQFINCEISNIKAEQTNMVDSIFTNCRLMGINWNEWILGKSYLVPVRKFENCQLKYHQFVEMSFRKFDFSHTGITGSMFADCNLSGASFLGCTLDNTEFFRCDLTEADFRDAVGYIIDIETNRLKEARFSFPEVVNLLNGLGIVIDG